MARIGALHPIYRRQCRKPFRTCLCKRETWVWNTVVIRYFAHILGTHLRRGYRSFQLIKSADRASESKFASMALVKVDLKASCSCGFTSIHSRADASSSERSRVPSERMIISRNKLFSILTSCPCMLVTPPKLSRKEKSRPACHRAKSDTFGCSEAFSEICGQKQRGSTMFALISLTSAFCSKPNLAS